MNFQDFGMREVLMLARWAAMPLGALLLLVGWMAWLSTRQRALHKRLAAVEARLGVR